MRSNVYCGQVCYATCQYKGDGVPQDLPAAALLFQVHIFFFFKGTHILGCFLKKLFLVAGVITPGNRPVFLRDCSVGFRLEVLEFRIYDVGLKVEG